MRSMAGEVDTSILRQERDSFREKFEHMKILVKELQQENQTLKIRREGVETVAQLLQESRQEIAILQKQKSLLSTAVHNLQNRLASNQLPVNPVCEEGEVIIPGTSKELLDNLVRENARLHNTIQNLPPADFQEKKVVEELDQRVCQLEMEKEELQELNKELEAAICGSDNVKVQQLSRCRGQVMRMQRDAQVQGVLCHSLSGEISTLRQHLRQFSRQTLDMDIRLRNFEESSLKEKEKAVQSSVTQSSQDQPDSNILLEEKKRLEKGLQEALTNNQRWQEYDNSREKFVHELTMKNEELENRLKKCQSGEVNTLLSTANQELRKAQEEIRELHRKLEGERRQRELREREVALLQVQLSTPGTHSDEATINALRAQVQACTEDFEMEREDRTRAQQRVMELEMALEMATKEVQSLRMNAPQLAQRYPGIRMPYSTSESRHYGSMAPHALESRGPRPVMGTDASLRHSGSSGSLAQRGVDGCPTSLPVIPKFSAPKKEDKSGDFSCPSCGKFFPENRHEELVQHIDKCWNNVADLAE